MIESIWKNRFQGQFGIAGGGSWTILWYFPLEMKESSVVMQTQSWGFWEFSLVNFLLRSVILSWATLGKVSWILPHRDMYNRHTVMFTSEYFEFCGTIQRAGIYVILNKRESLPGQLLLSYLQYFLVLWWAGCCHISYSKVEEKKNLPTCVTLSSCLEAGSRCYSWKTRSDEALQNNSPQPA